MPRNVWPLDMEFYGKSFRLRSSHSNIMRALDFLRLWSLITCWKSQGTLHFWYYLLFWYLLDIHFIWSSVFSSRVTGIGSGSKYSARSASFKETEENKVFFLSKGLMVLIQARSTQSTLPPSWRGKLLSRCDIVTLYNDKSGTNNLLSPYLFSIMTTIHRHYFLDVMMLGQNFCPRVMSLLTLTRALLIIHCHQGTI